MRRALAVAVLAVSVGCHGHGQRVGGSVPRVRPKPSATLAPCPKPWTQEDSAYACYDAPQESEYLREHHLGPDIRVGRSVYP